MILHEGTLYWTPLFLMILSCSMQLLYQTLLACIFGDLESPKFRISKSAPLHVCMRCSYVMVSRDVEFIVWLRHSNIC